MSATERLKQKREPKMKVLDKDIAGMRAGQRMLVSTPDIINRYVQKIPYGELRTMNRIRNELARQNQCDTTCPMTTSIFLRMVAEAAIEQMNDGAKPADITPFWRIIEPGDKIARKLDIDKNWIAEQRQSEK